MNKTTDGKTKVVNAFQDLVKTVYPNLRMLGNHSYSEDSLKNVIRSGQDDLFGTDDNTISEAESEVLNYINRRKKQSERTSLIDLKNHFSRKPYGWYPNALWTVTARLYKRSKIELKQNSNLLEDESVLNAMLNSANYGLTLLEPQDDIDPRLVKNLKQTYTDAFNEGCSYNEAKDVAGAFKDKLKEMLVEINQLLMQKKEYPFLSGLDDFSEKLEKLTKKEYAYFLKNLPDFEDDLLDNKESLLDPVKRFWNGEQKTIYDDIKNFVGSNTANIGYVEGDEFDTLKTLINSHTPYKGNSIQLAKASKDSLTKKVLDAIIKEKEIAVAAIEKVLADLQGKYEFKGLDSTDKVKVLKPIQNELSQLEKLKIIAVIRDVKRKVEEELYNDQLNLMMSLSQLPDPGDDNNVINDPPVHYISKSNIKVDFSKTELKTEEDVDEYIAAFSKALKEHIKNNRRISL